MRQSISPSEVNQKNEKTSTAVNLPDEGLPNKWTVCWRRTIVTEATRGLRDPWGHLMVPQRTTVWEQSQSYNRKFHLMRHLMKDRFTDVSFLFLKTHCPHTRTCWIHQADLEDQTYNRTHVYRGWLCIPLDLLPVLRGKWSGFINTTQM